MGEERCHFSFVVNGYPVQASYAQTFIDTVVYPLIEHWRSLAATRKERIVVFLAAPPAAGKSTLSLLFEHLSAMDGKARIQALGMDGFHHYQRYILSHSVWVDGQKRAMKEVKGCPESFDFDRLSVYVRRLKQERCLTWPLYDRSIHDVRDDAIWVEAPIVVLEGNYLLLDEAPWNQLAVHCDDSIFIFAEEAAVRERLIHRKMAGGMAPHEALAFCERSDLRNVRRILKHVLPAQHVLQLREGDYHLSKG